MRSRLSQSFNWRRVLRLSTGITLIGTTVLGVGTGGFVFVLHSHVIGQLVYIITVSLAAASVWTINRIRPRTYVISILYQ